MTGKCMTCETPGTENKSPNTHQRGKEYAMGALAWKMLFAWKIGTLW
jgi:hypothetical protein